MRDSMVNMVGMTNMLDQNGLMQQVGIKMLDKVMDQQKDSNANLVKMMEQSVQPNLGSNFDVSV